jgi:hypothetical protein
MDSERWLITLGFYRFGFAGLPHTWDNRQQYQNNINVRLHHGLGDDRFMELFNNTRVTHIQTSKSDHCALSISLRRSDWVGGGSTRKQFRSENIWTRHEGGWQTGNQNLEDVHQALACSALTWPTGVDSSVQSRSK